MYASERASYASARLPSTRTQIFAATLFRLPRPLSTKRMTQHWAASAERLPEQFVAAANRHEHLARADTVAGCSRILAVTLSRSRTLSRSALVFNRRSTWKSQRR